MVAVGARVCVCVGGGIVFYKRLFLVLFRMHDTMETNNNHNTFETITNMIENTHIKHYPHLVPIPPPPPHTTFAETSPEFSCER